MFTKLLIFVACVGVILAADNNAVISCIKGKYDADLGNAFTSCYESSRAMRPERVKTCYTKVMKDAGVVVTTRSGQSGQMTVDRTKFGQWADANSQKPIGKAMKECFNSARAGDDMYKEASRASQCVFRKVKKTCNS